MTYGLFNLTSGNLIDSVNTEQAALTMLAMMLDENPGDADALGLVIANEDDRTITSMRGRPLAEWVHAGGGAPAETYYL